MLVICGRKGGWERAVYETNVLYMNKRIMLVNILWQEQSTLKVTNLRICITVTSNERCKQSIFLYIFTFTAPKLA